MTGRFDLVVASHLRWSFVWQRPQQLLSRLARHHRILFVEEPVFHGDQDPAAIPQLNQAAENVWILAPETRRPDREGTPIWEDHEAIGEQVRFAMRMLDFRERGLWFYTPLPEFLVDVVDPDVMIYDVMDELSNFRFAPHGLRDQEARLLRRADVVFTGGASLYEAKRAFNPNTHLFASGVDAAHYARACRPETPVPSAVDAIPAPRAAYIGVIDERMDYAIIAEMAARHPGVQFIMAGPVVKVDPADLPRAANLHYIGQRCYEELPGILKAADICLMPFAMNEATRFISPTKTLEYMATHRPIVSTPVRDVQRFYSDIVYLASNAEEFARQIDMALNESEADRALRRLREDKILAEHSWDAIAESMERLMQDAYSVGARIAPSMPASPRISRPAAPRPRGARPAGVRQRT